MPQPPPIQTERDLEPLPDQFDSAEGDAFTTPDQRQARTDPDDREDIPRDRFGRYYLPDPDNKQRKRGWTRTTTFAKTISDTYALSLWGQRMVAKGIALRPDFLALAAAYDVEKDKTDFDQLTTQAKEAAEANRGANLGTAIHAFTEQFDLGQDPQVPAPWDADVAAYAALLSRFGMTAVPDLIEQVILCPFYELGGTFDRVYTAPDWELPRIGDVKTAKTLEYGWVEIAVQLAVYAHAKWIWKGGNNYVPMPRVDKQWAHVIHIRPGSGVAERYRVDIAKGWEIAQLCSTVRSTRKRKDLAELEDPQVVVAEPEMVTRECATCGIAKEKAGDFQAYEYTCDACAEYEVIHGKLPGHGQSLLADVLASSKPYNRLLHRVDAATELTDLSAIWKEATAAGLWRGTLVQRAMDRKQQLQTARG